MRGINPATWLALCELAFLNTLPGATKPTRFRLDHEGCAWYLDRSAVAVPVPTWQAWATRQVIRRRRR
jgi:hypothetical protein